VASQALRLAQYLVESPLGSLGFEKMQAHDFVMVGSNLRLVDLDNLAVGEPPCTADVHCAVKPGYSS